MDKPALLEAIQQHTQAEQEYIQELAKEELARQKRELVMGMLHKKPVKILESIVQYKETVHAISKGKEREAKGSSSGNSIRPGKKSR
jgi:mannose-6-phosphate isomerase class I